MINRRDNMAAIIIKNQAKAPVCYDPVFSDAPVLYTKPDHGERSSQHPGGPVRDKGRSVGNALPGQGRGSAACNRLR